MRISFVHMATPRAEALGRVSSLPEKFFSAPFARLRLDATRIVLAPSSSRKILGAVVVKLMASLAQRFKVLGIVVREIVVDVMNYKMAGAFTARAFVGKKLPIPSEVVVS